ncbi:MAG: Tad domain-containing protein [Deltaproteobacteria bacterium]|nr:Tad domain-containing protein [Deltaproteobacteria bacterium]
MLRRARHRRGAAAILVALCLMSLMLVAAFSTNMGIAVNDKIRMQEAADLSTYAVAYSEAASLNELTLLNKQIAEEAQSCRDILEHGGVPWSTPCNCGSTDPQAEIQVELCKIRIDLAIEDFVRRAQYDRTVTPALQAGVATADANFSGTGAQTSFFDDVGGSPTARGTYWVTWSTSTLGGGTTPSLAEFRQRTDTAFNYQFNTYCASYCGYSGTLIRAPVTMPTWFYKSSRDPDVWVAGRTSGTPAKRFLDVDYRSSGRDRGFFGASSTGGDDKLYAYAVAKPYDGSVGPSELNGNQANGNMNIGGIYLAQGIEYPKLSMYDEYRARLAGVNDNLAGDLTPADLVGIDGAREGRAWDTSRFEH